MSRSTVGSCLDSNGCKFRQHTVRDNKASYGSTNTFFCQTFGPGSVSWHKCLFPLHSSMILWFIYFYIKTRPSRQAGKNKSVDFRGGSYLAGRFWVRGNRRFVIVPYIVRYRRPDTFFFSSHESHLPCFSSCTNSKLNSLRDEFGLNRFGRLNSTREVCPMTEGGTWWLLRPRRHTNSHSDC